MTQDEVKQTLDGLGRLLDDQTQRWKKVLHERDTVLRRLSWARFALGLVMGALFGLLLGRVTP